MSSRIKFVTLLLLVLFSSSMVVSAQDTPEKKEDKKEEKKPEPSATPPTVSGKDASKPVTAEQVAESTILVYAFPGGRVTLNQIRKTAIESGKTSIANADGKMDQATYRRFTHRGETSGKDKVRLDQEFPNARYSLVSGDDKIFGIFNDSVFSPREDASRAFQNQVVYGIESLLRYKENESTLALGGREKVFGVDFYFVDLTDKQNRKMRFYVSAKSFRVMMVDYEDNGVKYRRKFYNYRYAQGTLVPYRTVLYSGDKIIEETEIGTMTYGQKIDEGMFSAG